MFHNNKTNIWLGSKCLTRPLNTQPSVAGLLIRCANNQPFMAGVMQQDDMRILLIINLLALILLGCEKSDFEKHEEQIINEMGWLFDANPMFDATNAIDRGDFKYRGVYGVGAIVPGLDKFCLDLEKDVIFIKGTSDAMIGYKHQQLNALAHLYAREYNFTIIIHLSNSGVVSCAA